MKGLEGSKLGRYELRFRVAQGGMSEVYLGYDRRVKRYVAVKVLYGSDEPFVRRFEREARAVGTLSHDHILPLYDFGEQRPWYYLVMPFVEGGTLRDYLHKRERLNLDEAGSFLEQIASALQHAHEHGVVHRDVKPSNILLRLDGHAYLVDFGLAKAKIEAEFQTHSGAMVGTPEYMAPEQSDGRNDFRSDIYSLGIILYQMLTGRVPFMADSPVGVTLKHIQTPPLPPSQLNSEIPAAIEEVMLKALAKAPEDRFQEAEAFALAYKMALIQKRTRDLGEEALACVFSGESEVEYVQNAQQHTDSTMAAIEQITTQLNIPSTKPQLFPLERDKSSFIPYTSEMFKKKKRISPVNTVLLAFILILCITLPLLLAWETRPVPKLRPRPTHMQPARCPRQSPKSLIYMHRQPWQPRRAFRQVQASPQPSELVRYSTTMIWIKRGVVGSMMEASVISPPRAIMSIRAWRMPLPGATPISRASPTPSCQSRSKCSTETFADWSFA
ncbi:protein kinase domain-containing protein [Dictyobacter kobayashii]|uniref:non-specific serine/threonine protein kinase n=1 Tax=Dictyobacter kobayashii TaxID=2014872 RepID=A0A402APP4_9CHLR|nr:protein kinase [Dictyobacter kobayashii]GCE20999.1 hypothetical protein KDK_47990 [Dictyobacter kobayashii]